MSWGVVNGLMLLGLAGAAIPVLIHLLNRRWDPVIDWGAMQFLDLGRPARRRVQVTEWLLMLARMGLLALVALALARPFWKPSAAAGAQEGMGTASASRRDVVLVLDGSASMNRKAGGTTPRAEAIAWAQRFVARLGPADSVAILLAGDHAHGLLNPPSFDRAKIQAALAEAGRRPALATTSDLPAALAEAFRVAERTQNPARDVIMLTDGQRFAWRPGEAARWALLRDLHRRLPIPPKLWAVPFLAGQASMEPDGSVGPLEISRGLLPPGMDVTVRTVVANAGPGSLTRTAELLVDGQPVPRSAQVVGPMAAGSRTPLTFRTALTTSGSHLLSVRLVGGDDSLADDDEASVSVDVAAALPVLLVDGEPGLEPFRGETDFLRAALAPAHDEAPLVHATVVDAGALTPDSLPGQRVVVLANVEALAPEVAAALESLAAGGGGIWFAPGPRTEARLANERLFRNGEGWLPARLGDWKGDLVQRQPLAHPAPHSFNGPLMAPFRAGDDPALGTARLFGYWTLEPSKREPAAVVAGRLDTGDPWLVERPFGRGRVLVMAGPADADGGTLPVNPDFVPWVHEVVFHLADPGSNARVVGVGEPLVLPLDPPPPAGATTMPVRTPSGRTLQAAVFRSGAIASVRVDATGEPGAYRIERPGPAGGALYGVVSSDSREFDLAPLEPAEAAHLGQGWPLSFETQPDRLAGRVLTGGGAGRQEAWRGLLLAALVGLCLEVWLTRQLVRGRGPEGGS